MSTAAVHVEGLTRNFGAFVAVDHVSFTVRQGDIFGFLGPNGAGKTTTIRMLAGLLRPSAGRAWVAGVDVRADPLAVRERIGYMSQRFSLYGDLTISENIDLFAGLYGVTGVRRAARRAWVLAMAGLEGRERQLTAELPLGWKQRLALGCAVLHEPPLLFLDEPTSGVDPVARRSFWDLINEMAAAGTTVLVSTHYMEEAENCHRLILMNRGRLIADGEPDALRRRMTEPLWEVDVDDPAAAVVALRAEAGLVVDAALFGRHLHVVTGTGADRPERIRQALDRRGFRVTRVRRFEPSLEDVFVSLVRRGGGAPAG